MHNILIVGASGFIGSKLIPSFENNFNTVLAGYSNLSNNKIINLDLTNNEEVDYFVKDCIYFDSVIFLVGLAHKKGMQKDFNAFKKINYDTLKNLLSSFDRYNKLPNKIIFASTISIYGEKLNNDIYYEDGEKTPLSPYAITKLMAEKFLLDNYSSKTWILRFSPVYSKNFRLNINKRTKIGNFFYCIGDGSSKLSLCNINNIIFSIHSIIKDKVPFGAYNISDPINYTYKGILNMLKAKKIIYIPIIFMKILFFLGKNIKNIYLMDNTIKLITNNVYPSKKIEQFVKFKHKLEDYNVSDI